MNTRIPGIVEVQVYATRPDRANSRVSNSSTSSRASVSVAADDKLDLDSDVQASNPPPTNFVLALTEATQILQKSHRNADSPVLVRVDTFGQRMSFLGVRSGLNSKLDVIQLRKTIGAMLEVGSEFSIVQVVGDSGSAFSSDGKTKATKALESFIAPASVIAYGYTAADGDANSLVNLYLANHTIHARYTVGNVVQDSLKAINEWCCEASERVQSFVMPYNEDGRPTHFGDDTWLSDRLMSGTYGDRFLCLEGGPQSIEQAIHVLMNGVSLVAVSGLREPDKASLFSAAALLQNLSIATRKEKQNLQLVRDTYLNNHAPEGYEQRSRIVETLDYLFDAPNVAELLSSIKNELNIPRRPVRITVNPRLDAGNLKYDKAFESLDELARHVVENSPIYSMYESMGRDRDRKAINDGNAAEVLASRGVSYEIE